MIYWGGMALCDFCKSFHPIFMYILHSLPSFWELGLYNYVHFPVSMSDLWSLKERLPNAGRGCSFEAERVRGISQ